MTEIPNNKPVENEWIGIRTPRFPPKKSVNAFEVIAFTLIFPLTFFIDYFLDNKLSRA